MVHFVFLQTQTEKGIHVIEATSPQVGNTTKFTAARPVRHKIIIGSGRKPPPGPSGASVISNTGSTMFT